MKRSVTRVFAVIACAGAWLNPGSAAGLIPETDPMRALGPAYAQDYAKLSPFEAIRWNADEAEVLVRGRWYRLQSIDRRSSAKLLAFCRDQYGGRAIKRFEEDMVQVLTEIGGKPGRTVDLGLVDLESGKTVELDEVEMTAANRSAILAAARGREEAATGAAAGPVERVTREHAAEPAPGFEDLVRWPVLACGRSLPRAQAELDLDQLEWLLRERFSYRDLEGVDHRAALDALRCGLPAEVDLFAFARQLAKLIARFGDGHSGVEDEPRPAGETFLPCLVENIGTSLFALEPDRSGFVDPARPQLTKIDGLEVERWLEAARAGVPDWQNDAKHRRAVRSLRELALLRSELGLPGSDRVRLTLADERGKKEKEVELDVSRRRPTYGQRVQGTHRVLAGNVGYLRIESMERDDEPFLASLDEAMASYRKTKGLVIDVRGNLGGSRAALVRLAPYFMAPEEACFVSNVAAYRLAPGEARETTEGYLADRFLFPRSSARHDEDVLQAIDEVARRFEPEWTPPEAEFSSWHYLVLRRDSNPAAYTYQKPVVVLLDADCFSATDIFLAAFAGRPGVTLMGRTSGGGSGRKRSFPLEHSGLTVSLSSMASFRADGRRIDGRGIAPDVVLDPEPTDLIGRGDRVLEEAIRRLH